MATMSRVAEAVHPADAFLGVPPQSGGLGCGSGNPSVSFGLRTTPDPKSPGSYTPPPRPILYLEDLRQPAVPLPAPEPPVPSGKMVPDTKNVRILRLNPQIHLRISKRYAEAALVHYNRRKKIKFELIDVKPCNSVPEPRCCYTHINFTARPMKEGSQEQLFFAELLHWGRRKDCNGSQLSVGRGQSTRGYFVTCCEPLGSDATVGQKFLKLDGTTGVIRKHADFTYCFACGDKIYHPKGEKYVAGHCTVPCIYDCIR